MRSSVGGFGFRRLVRWVSFLALWARRAAARRASIPGARHVPGTVRASAVAVDVLAARRGPTDEPCSRTVVASCGDLEEAVVRNPKRQRQPLRRDDADGDRDLPPAGPQRVRLLDQCCGSSSREPTRPFPGP